MKDFNDNKGSRLKEMTVSILVWTIDKAWLVSYSLKSSTPIWSVNRKK
jgi:hypothetical protein